MRVQFKSCSNPNTHSTQHSESLAPNNVVHVLYTLHLHLTLQIECLRTFLHLSLYMLYCCMVVLVYDE